MPLSRVEVGFGGVLLILAACSGDASPADAEPRDSGAGDAACSEDAGEIDAAMPADGDRPGGDAGHADAALPPIRDDAAEPNWSWHDKAARVMDAGSLEAAFSREGWSLPPGTEVYAARVLDGVGGPAYVLYEAGGGAFSTDYWPASTVKVLAALGALTFVHDRGFTGAADVTWDSGFGDRLSAIYDRSLRDSSNIDYTRTIRVAGFDWLNATFLSGDNGFPTAVIQRSYASGVSVRDIPGLTLTEGTATDYVPARSSTADYGCGSDGNCVSLFELTEAVRRIVLDAEITEPERFDLDPNNITGLSDALCHATPSFFADGAADALGGTPRICHKPGWVPDIDCLDHGLIESDVTGERFLLGVSTPETAGTGSCPQLSVIARHVLLALEDRTGGVPLQPDAGIALRVQLEDRGTTPERRRAYTITVDAPGADHVELYTDRRPIGEASGPGPRFSVDHDYIGGGDRLVVVRAFEGDWSTVDTLSIARFMTAGLSFSAGDDIELSDSLAAWQRELAADHPDPLRGKLHTLTLPSTVPSLTRNVIQLPPEGDETYPNGYPRHGGTNVVDQSGYGWFDTEDFTYQGGPQQRLVVEMTPDGPKVWNALPGGQAFDPDSPHHADEMEHWRRNEAPPMYFAEADVREHAERTLRFVP